MALVLVTSIALAGCSSDRGTPTVEVPVLGSIAGFVVTEAIAPIPGVNVTIPGNRTTTNTTGGFTFAGLAPGLYVVEASAATFLERQTTVQVTAGNISEVRLVLPVNASALAFHQAFSFRGFTDAHGGSGAPEVGSCQCDFSAALDGDWRTIIVEAKWVDSVSPVISETEFLWGVAIAGNAVNGTGASPLLGRVESANLTGQAEAADVRVAPSSTWIYTNQRFDVLVTVWYGEPAPEGWRGLSA
ncbi:MAG: carboxypeptidase-like regulatory domain-containing protein [Thermoplasmatota archaeon]